ncbi:MAG: exonuclease SbcCD subunit D [Lachnospiraceae bacterium]|nr:exonuclease SbcCD subunit D [Lachnospiraceae bacterium]
MKIFHLSDLHIGLKLYNRDLLEDQKYVFDQIIKYAKEESPDVILIAGDIYDKAVPSAEAVEVFDDFIAELANETTSTVMTISGNHDSAPRVDTYRRVLAKQKLFMIGKPPVMPDEYIEKVTLTDEFGPVDFYLLPFVKPSMVKLITGTDKEGRNLSYNDAMHALIARENIDPNELNVFVSHQFFLPVGKTADDVERMESEIRTVGNIDEISADVLEPFDYAALGHIHKPMTVGDDRFRYSGTPMPYSVSEAGQKKGVVMATLREKGSAPSVSILPLKPLHEVRVIEDTLEEILKQGCDDYVTAVLTDKVEFDIFDMQARLRAAFPNLLEIRRVNTNRADYSRKIQAEEELDPYDLCCSFLKDMDEDSLAIIRDIINSLEGSGEEDKFTGGIL